MFDRYSSNHMARSASSLREVALSESETTADIFRAAEFVFRSRESRENRPTTTFIRNIWHARARA